jgi:hypothetical protein
MRSAHTSYSIAAYRSRRAEPSEFGRESLSECSSLFRNFPGLVFLGGI